jgi:phage tail sheath protein FI
MTIPTSYPGVYVQELPSLVHSVQPAPTSIAVFVGYTHPLQTNHYLTAVPLFSFADYQTNFGGFFSSIWQPDYVGQAVFQFFQNAGGGSMCYVVGLPALEYYDDSQTPPVQKGSVTPAGVVVTSGTASITFTARQPVGIPGTPTTPAAGIAMQVAISNVQKTSADADTADIVISYGTRVETYRKVQIGNIVTALQNSGLVSVAPSSPAPTAYPLTGSPFSLVYGASVPQATWTVLSLGDFAQVFADYASLDKVPIFNLLATPGISDTSVTSEAIAYCERKRAFYIMDTPSPETTAGWDANSVVGTLAAGSALTPSPPVSINAAVYYPWLQTADPVTTAPASAPPSGFVAGIYGQEDNARGVWKSPAGIETTLRGTAGVDPKGVVTDPQQGILNENAINCLRQFPGVGTVVFGARTTAGANTNTAQQQWRYVAVRRMALFLEQSLYASLTWAVFQPNDVPLWNALTQEVSAFMLSLFRQGAFAGTKPSESFLVQCDATTTTPFDVANGMVNIVVGFAPLLPAEFVIIKIAQLAGQAQS